MALQYKCSESSQPFVRNKLVRDFLGFANVGKKKGGSGVRSPDWFPVPFGLQAASFETCGQVAAQLRVTCQTQW
jgi:hypothetical protein